MLPVHRYGLGGSLERLKVQMFIPGLMKNDSCGNNKSYTEQGARYTFQNNFEFYTTSGECVLRLIICTHVKKKPKEFSARLCRAPITHQTLYRGAEICLVGCLT